MELNRIKIGVSSCLLGEEVRYDGTGKYQPLIIEGLSGRFELVSLCPEVGIGQTVPRPPVQRVMIDGRVRLLRVEDASFDLTDRMHQFALQTVKSISEFSGFIFKSRSPSCGLRGVKLLSEEGVMMAKGEGMFAEIICQQLSKLPVVEESDLTNSQKIEAFAKQVEHYSLTL